MSTHTHRCGTRGEYDDAGGWGRDRGFGPPLPLKVAAVVGGFMVFPPLGVAALAYFALRHKFGGGPGCGHSDDGSARRGHHGLGKWRERSGEPSTGNSAFDARRREVLDKIEAERQKLREEAKAFADFAGQQKRARDQAEFDRFSAEQAKAPDGGGNQPA